MVKMMIRRFLTHRLFFGILLSAALASCTSAAKPAATPTAAPSPVPTAAPNKPSISIFISADVNRQADGTSLVRDPANAYEFTLGEEWMAIPVSKAQIDRMAQASPAPDAEFLRLAQKLDEKKLDAFRLIGMNTDSTLASAASPTLVLVTAIPDRISAALPMPELAHMIQDTVFTDSKDVERDVVHNANGLDIAVVEGSYDYLSTEGNTVRSRSKVFGFQASARVILIQFITPVESGGDVLPGTDRIIDTIQRMKP